MSGYQLKILQEAITLLVFVGFAWLYLGEALRWNYLLAMLLLLGQLLLSSGPEFPVYPSNLTAHEV